MVEARVADGCRLHPWKTLLEQLLLVRPVAEDEVVVAVPVCEVPVSLAERVGQPHMVRCPGQHARFPIGPFDDVQLVAEEDVERRMVGHFPRSQNVAALAGGKPVDGVRRRAVHRRAVDEGRRVRQRADDGPEVVHHLREMNGYGDVGAHVRSLARSARCFKTGWMTKYSRCSSDAGTSCLPLNRRLPWRAKLLIISTSVAARIAVSNR